MRQKFYFVAGEQVITRQSITVLDAWNSLEIYAKTNPIPDEFRRLPITATDAEGQTIATRTWANWHQELLRDTYGDDFQAIANRANSLL